MAIVAHTTATLLPSVSKLSRCRLLPLDPQSPVNIDALRAAAVASAMVDRMTGATQQDIMLPTPEEGDTVSAPVVVMTEADAKRHSSHGVPELGNAAGGDTVSAQSFPGESDIASIYLAEFGEGARHSSGDPYGSIAHQMAAGGDTSAGGGAGNVGGGGINQGVVIGLSVAGAVVGLMALFAAGNAVRNYNRASHVEYSAVSTGQSGSLAPARQGTASALHGHTASGRLLELTSHVLDGAARAARATTEDLLGLSEEESDALADRSPMPTAAQAGGLGESASAPGGGMPPLESPTFAAYKRSMKEAPGTPTSAAATAGTSTRGEGTSLAGGESGSDAPRVQSIEPVARRVTKQGAAGASDAAGADRVVPM